MSLPLKNIKFQNPENTGSTIARSLLLYIFCVLLISCSKDKKNIIASVNRETITAEEIAFAYEFAPRKITQQGKEKALKTVLDGMVKEKLFAEEAKNIGLDKTPELQEIVDYFTRAAINRELYLKHVRDSVFIDEKSLRQAYKRSRTVLTVKHFFTTDKEAAELISKGKMTANHCPLTPNTTEIIPFGEVDIITFNQINLQMENVIYHLPLLQLSEPFFDGKNYHVFLVVDKSVSKMQTEEDFLQNKSSLETALRKRKEHQKAFEFVNRIMAPQKLMIKAETLNWMIAQIQSQHYQKIKPGFLDEQELAFLKHGDFYDKNIAEFKSGHLTVEDFQRIYAMNPIRISFKNENSIGASLQNIIAIYVRDKIFSDIGMAENLNQKKSVKEEQKFWKTRLLANEMKRKIYNDLQKTSKDSMDFRYNEKIEEFTQQLIDKSDIKIDHKKLLAIKTSDEGLSRKIDFFAKHLQ